MEKILIIGATGFIGKHLVNKLSKFPNYKIICMIRKQSEAQDIEFLKKNGADLIYGDLYNENTLKGITKGVEYVFYLAGGGDVSSLSNKDYRNLKDYNIKALENFLKSLSKIKKLIFFSSISAIGIHPGEIIDEKTKCNPTIPHEQCKYLAEQLIKKYSKIKNYKFSILRPSIVYGEYGLGDSFNMIKMIEKGYFFMPGNGKNITPWVYAGDVADAAVLLMKKGDNEVFIINHEEKISFRKIIKLVSKNLGKPVLFIRVPAVIVAPAVFILEKLFLTFNKSPPINMYRLRSMTSDRIYSIDKLKKIGHKEKERFESAIKKTIDWYKENGYL